MGIIEELFARQRAAHPGMEHCYYCDINDECAWYPKSSAPRDRFGHVECAACKRERERWESAPKCEWCGEPELPEFLANFEGFLVCRECMEEIHEMGEFEARMSAEKLAYYKRARAILA